MNRKMTKTERVKAAIAFKEVDRIPISLWPHYTTVDQDARSLADAQFQFYQMLDLDFVKLMPYGLYAVEDYGPVIEKFNLPDQWARVSEPFIQREKDWEKITPVDVHKGTYGNQLKYAERLLTLMKEAKDEAPVVQTIFSPLTILYKLIGEQQLLKSMVKESEQVHRALGLITKTTMDFVRANMELGVSGFFFASQLANYRFMDDRAYDEFGEAYDRVVFSAYQDETWFNIVHIHSFTREREKAMFERLLTYPANCVNWHDRWAGPSLSETRKLTDKCLIGGINEEQYFNVTEYRNVYDHVREAISQGGRVGFMLGPGCTIYENTPMENYMAARIAVDKYGRP